MRTSVKVSGGTVALGGGIKAFRTCVITAVDESWSFDLVLDVSVHRGGSTIDAVRLVRKPGTTIQTDELRRIALVEILRDAMPQAMAMASTGDAFLNADPDTLGHVERLKRAAVVHRVARVLHRNVIDDVAENLAVSRATAGRLIAAARSANLLDEEGDDGQR